MSPFKDPPILITGATGFIGRQVCKKLIEHKSEFIGICRNPPSNANNLFKLDFLDKDLTRKFIEKTQPKILIHLAWDVTHKQYWESDINLEYYKATVNLFDAFIEKGGTKIIVTGTCAEYSTSSNPLKEDEDYAEKISLYGQAKRLTLDYLRLLAIKNPNLDYAWLRIFGIYGPGEHPERLFPSILHCIKNNLEFTPKTPDIFSDYVHVEDLAVFIVEIIQLNNLGIINIGSELSISILDLYNTLKSYWQVGKFHIKKSIHTPNVNSRIPDCTKLKSHGLHYIFQDTLKNKVPRLLHQK